MRLVLHYRVKESIHSARLHNKNVIRCDSQRSVADLVSLQILFLVRIYYYFSTTGTVPVVGFIDLSKDIKPFMRDLTTAVT